MSDVHVYPTYEELDHDLETQNCGCFPKIIQVCNGNFIITHNEFREVNTSQ